MLYIEMTFIKNIFGTLKIGTLLCKYSLKFLANSMDFRDFSTSMSVFRFQQFMTHLRFWVLKLFIFGVIMQNFYQQEAVQFMVCIASCGRLTSHESAATHLMAGVCGSYLAPQPGNGLVWWLKCNSTSHLQQPRCVNKLTCRMASVLK